MASRAGKKRSATQNGGEPGASKKTRFVEPEDDPVNFAEQVDSALEGPSRKGKVKNEGYESDSSDDGEGVVFSRKKGGAEEEEDDMFAIADKEEKEEASGKKKEKFMRLGDIEGQEFNNGSDEESGEESDPADRLKKKEKEMGFELSSFNMREEMEEGKFTEDGSYVKTYDPHAVHDRWMDGLDEREIKLARKRHKDQERKQREKMEREEKELAESGGQVGVEMKLLPLLKKGETVLEALQRLGASSKRKQPAPKRKAKPAGEEAMNVDKTVKEPTDIEIITELASKLMSFGDADVYPKTYEEIVRHVRSAGNVEPNWEPPSADVKYEYKWSAAEAGGEVFGPFSEEEVKAWFKATYFGEYGEKIKIRRVGGEWGDWDDVVQ